MLGLLLQVSRSRGDPVLPYIAIGLFSSYCGWIVFRQTDYNYVLLGDPFWLLAGLTVVLKRLNDDSLATGDTQAETAVQSSR
jgi:hypothetical protein